VDAALGAAVDQGPDVAAALVGRGVHTAFSKKLGRVVMMKDAPDHGPDDFVMLSGTKVREKLAAGEPLPEEFARPEVAAILMEHYRAEA
jgi:sulfate adenylyltransferase